jgi:phage-related minor tail protein
MLSGLFGTTANAKGNVYDMPSLAAYSGTVVTQPTFFANGGNVMGEAGPEGIFPLKRGADGKLGVSAEGVGGANVTVNVINNGDNQARTERRSDGQGGSIIDVIVERTKASLAGDIGRGSGPLPAVLEGTYGLSRSAGAY